MLPNLPKAGGEPQTLECAVGKPCEIQLNVHAATTDDKPDTNYKRCSGVTSVDIHPAQIPCNLGGLRFKNYYTGFISVRVKIKTDGDTGSTKDGCIWKTCLHQYCLMPNIHCESGSQDYFTIKQDELLFPPRDVMMVRLILQQPSPVWITFRVEEIALLADNTEEEENKSQRSVLEWLRDQSDHADGDESQESIIKDPTAMQISEHMHKMWALTETIKMNRQTQSSLGRFDVNGSYEINLLSYT